MLWVESLLLLLVKVSSEDHVDIVVDKQHTDSHTNYDTNKQLAVIEVAIVI